MVNRFSGTFAARPAAVNVVNARYYATDNTTIYQSRGGTWIIAAAAEQEDIVDYASGTLAARPQAGTMLGWIYVDTTNPVAPVQYEAFPTAWAAVPVSVGGPGGAVDSVFGRSGTVVANGADYSAFYQGLDADLTAIAAVASQTSYGQAFLALVNAAGARAYIGAGTSNFDGAFASLTGKPTTLIGYGITDGQPLDTDLTNLAGISTNSKLAFRNGSGIWQARGLGTGLTDDGTNINATAAGGITGSGLVSGNLVGGGATSTSVVDSGLSIVSVAQMSDIPSDLSELTITDNTIGRNKLSYTGSALPATGSNLAPGTIYYGDIAANYSIAGFSPAFVEANASIIIYAHFTAAVTLTVPTCIRNADSGSTTSVTVPGAQYAVIQFFKTGAGNIRMMDNIQRGDDIGFVAGTMDGAGLTLVPGKLKGYITVPYSGTIQRWSIGADTGQVTFKVWKKAGGIPASGDSISTTPFQQLTSGTYVRSTDLSKFSTTTVTAGDVFSFQLATVDSGSPTEATFAVEIKKA